MNCSEWRNIELGDIIQYSKSKITIEKINTKNYVSTENMLPNKCGIVEASGIPNSKTVQKYSKGNVLISNIRPYFKKIWLAQNEGGASNDVLVMEKTTNEVDDEYIYYLLSNDEFFNYTMGTAKGTKMPRGDKKAILKYELRLPPLDEQKAIAKILSDLDEKIEINNKINKNLEEMAQAIFKRWFVDFEFLNQEGKPYKTSGGEMVESELGMIPKGWKIEKLGDLYDVKGGKRLPKGKVVQDRITPYPYIRVTDVTAGKINRKTLKYIDEDTRKKIDKYNINHGDIYISIAGTIGIVGIVNESLDDASLTENMAKIKVEKLDKYYLYLFLNSKIGQEIIKTKTIGSTQPKLPLYAIKTIKILRVDKKVRNDFYDNIVKMFLEIENNLEEIERLQEIRDILLPNLMSGEIRVPLK